MRRQQDEEEDEGGDTTMRVKYDARLHGARVAGRKEPLTTAFLQKYIQYAKNRYKCAPATNTGNKCAGSQYAHCFEAPQQGPAACSHRCFVNEDSPNRGTRPAQGQRRTKAGRLLGPDWSMSRSQKLACRQHI